MAIQINGKKVIHLGSMTIPVLKGEKGDQGVRGQQGIPGIDGKDGQTPLRGIDYWTTEDEEIIRQSIVSEVALGLSSKVDKVAGKGLSTEDFTTLLKQKLEELQNYDDRDIRELLEKALYNVTIDIKTGILTFHTIDESTFTVDLPLELIVSDGYLNKDTNTIVLVLANGNTIDIPVENLIKDFYSKSEVDQKIDNLAEEVAIDFETVDEKLAKAQVQIDTLKAENQAQQEELDILNSEYTEKELEGESVVISNGLPKSKIKVKGNGNSYQETTEGYNLLKYDIDIIKSLNTSGTWNGNTYTYKGVSITFNKDNTIYIKGTPSETFSIILNQDEISLLGNYMLGLKNNQAGLGFYFKNGNTNITYIGVGETITEKNVSFSESQIINRCVFQITQGNSFDITVFPVLYSGTSIPTYEPYTGGKATPNTNYKQDIEVIDTVNELNLEDKTISAYDVNAVIKKGEITINGTPSGVNFNQNIITFVAPKTETYSLHSFKSAVNNNIRFIYKINGAAWVNADQFPEIALNKGDTVTVYLRIDSTNAISNFTIAPMLYEGTYDGNKVFLPYGCIGLVQRGKNLYITNKTTGNSYTSNGVVFTIKKPNVINIKGTATGANAELFLIGNTWAESNNKYNNLKVGTKYTASMKVQTEQVNTYWINNATNTIASLYSTKPHATFTADENGISKVLLRVFEGVTVDEDIEIQLEEGDVATEIEPYKEPIVHSIDLAGEKLAKVGEIADLLKIGVDGSCNINDKSTGVYIFTGDEYFIKMSATKNTIFQFPGIKDLIKTPESTTIVIPTLSNYFDGSHSADYVWGNDIQGFGVNKSGYINVGLGLNSEITTSEELKAWLKEKYDEGNPVIVLYPLAKPTTITLPSIEPIELFEGTNVFELVTNLGTTMAVTYKVSNKSRLEKLELALLSNGGNV